MAMTEPKPEDIRQRLRHIAHRIRRFRLRLHALEAHAEDMGCPRCSGRVKDMGKEIGRALWDLQAESRAIPSTRVRASSNGTTPNPP